MKKIFYSALFLLLIVALTGLAIATAVLPYQLTIPAPARTLVVPVPVTPVG